MVARTPAPSQPAAVTARNCCARRTGSSAAARASGRLITERTTRDTKKTTKAAAVHGSPPCHPDTRTTVAPIANSVSQNTLNQPFRKPPTRTRESRTRKSQIPNPELPPCGLLPVIRDQIHRLRRRRAQLPQHRRQLAAMVAGVVDDVLHHLPDRGGAGLAAQQLELDRLIDSDIGERANIG